MKISLYENLTVLPILVKLQTDIQKVRTVGSKMVSSNVDTGLQCRSKRHKQESTDKRMNKQTLPNRKSPCWIGNKY